MIKKKLKNYGKNLQKRIAANEKALKKNPALAEEINELKLEAEKIAEELNDANEMIAADEKRIAKHTELENELKDCKKKIKDIRDRKQALVDRARLSITQAQAKELILIRWQTIYTAR